MRVLIFLSFFLLAVKAQAQLLFPIHQSNRWGYINAAGKVVIAPAYRVAKAFSEGLSAIRIKGTYGYIDTAGILRIPAVYDFGMAFYRGVALVYRDGRPLLIDEHGRDRLAGVYSQMIATGEDGYWRVKTLSGRYGIINDRGDIIIDTVYKNIRSFRNGRAVVIGFDARSPASDALHQQEYPDNLYTGMLDTSKQWVIPYGIWKGLQLTPSGYYRAASIDDTSFRNCWLNRDGRVVANEHVSDKWYLEDDNLQTGITAVTFLRRHEDSVIERQLRPTQTSYVGAIDSSGKILFANTVYSHLTGYANHRAFAGYDYSNWVMVDEAGRRVGDGDYTRIIGYLGESDEDAPFRDGRAIVEIRNGMIAVIDTAGQFIYPPFTLPANVRAGRRKGLTLILQEDISTQHIGHSYRYGLHDFRTGVTVLPRYYDINFDLSGDTLYAVTTAGERDAYIDKRGKTVWLGSKAADGKTAAVPDIDFMNRGYFVVRKSDPYSRLARDSYLASNNAAQNGRKNPIGGIRIVLGNAELWGGKWQGRAVDVVNTGSDMVRFATQDNRLYMNVQARKRDGEWADIEYLPGSWCGNSYYPISLAPGRKWHFTMPVYEGSIQTELRIKLQIETERSAKSDTAAPRILYSKPWKGSVNPAQFWRKREYFPSGLMDPYDD